MDWDVAAVLAMNRDHFGPKGPLELGSERLIREASLGDLQNVQHILRDGKVHPDVGDVSGYSALIAATVRLTHTRMVCKTLSCCSVQFKVHEGLWMALMFTFIKSGPTFPLPVICKVNYVLHLLNYCISFVYLPTNVHSESVTDILHCTFRHG